MSLICISRRRWRARAHTHERVYCAPQIIWISNSSIITDNHVWLLFKPIFAVHSVWSILSNYRQINTVSKCVFKCGKYPRQKIPRFTSYTHNLVRSVSTYGNILHMLLFFYRFSIYYVYVFAPPCENWDTLRMSAVNATNATALAWYRNVTKIISTHINTHRERFYR